MKRILLMLFLFASGTVHAAEDNLCGPLSLAAICEKYGIDMPIDGLCAAVKYDTTFGTNMLNLYNGAKELGLNAKALGMTYKDLKNDGYYIVVLDGDHFEAIQKKINGVIYLNDKDNIRTIPEKEFTPSWNGYAIEFSDITQKAIDKIEEEVLFAGPKLLLKTSNMDAGTKMEGDFIGFSFPLTNVGSDSLRIESIRATCSCVKYSITNAVIAPQETEYLYINVSSVGDIGVFTQYVTAKTNDPFYNDITLTVTGNIISELKAIPSEVVFENVHKNELLSKEIVVVSPNMRTFAIGDISCPENMSVTVKEQSGTECLLELALNADQEPGTYADSLIIQTQDNITKDIHVPVSWTVINEYEILPAEVVLMRKTTQNKYTQEFRILSKNDIEEVTIACDDMDVTWDIKKVNDKYLLKTYLTKKTGTESPSDTVLMLTINDRSINVPVRSFNME